MARADRISPSQLLFNRLPHQKQPILTDPTPINLNNISRGRTHVQNQNPHSREISNLPLGAKVWILHHEETKNGIGRPKLLKLGRMAGPTCWKLLMARIYCTAEDLSNYARSTDYSDLAGSTHTDLYRYVYMSSLILLMSLCTCVRKRACTMACVSA